MILYAAYVKGVLVDQVAAETEDTALAKLRMDYPKLEGEVTFEIVDGSYKEEPQKVAAATTTERTKLPTTPRPLKVIEASDIQITINVGPGSLSKEDLDELKKAAEEGMVVAKKK